MKKAKTWADYSASHENKSKILLYPITVGFDKKGCMLLERTPAQRVEKMFKKGRKDFPKYLSDLPQDYPNPESLLKDYLEFFNDDKNKGGKDSKRCGLTIDRPVWLCITPDQKNWRFQGGAGFDAINDAIDDTRNIIKVATLNDGGSLILHYRNRSMPDEGDLSVAIELESECDSCDYCKEDEPCICQFTMFLKIKGKGSDHPMVTGGN